MAFENLRLARQRVLYNDTNAASPLRFQLKIDGAKITPTSATITIYRAGVSTALVSAASMTLSGSILSYPVVTTTTASYPIETGYRAEVAVTYNAVVYERHFLFDVVKFLFHLDVAWDQLVALDDSIVGTLHNGVEDLGPLISAAYDVIHGAIETKIVKGKKALLNNVIDTASISLAGCYWVLSQHHLNKRELEVYRIYLENYERTLSDVLSSLKWDMGQSGEESAEPGGGQQVTLVL